MNEWMDGWIPQVVRGTRRLTRLDLKILRIKEKNFAIGKKKNPDEEQTPAQRESGSRLFGFRLAKHRVALRHAPLKTMRAIKTVLIALQPGAA